MAKNTINAYIIICLPLRYIGNGRWSHVCAFSSGMVDSKKFYLVDGGLTCSDTPPYTNLEITLREKGLLMKKETKRETVLLDAIIITHPDEDHLGGVNKLIANYTITCPVITTEATMLTKANLTYDEPGLPEEVKLMFPTARRRIYKDITNKTEIMKDPKFFPEPKDKSNKSNKSSILFAVVGSVLLTGDSTGQLINEATGLGKELAETQKLRVFQVPHHGSEANSFIPYEAAKKIPSTDPLHALKGKHDAYKYALFYRGIKAHTYFVSHGDHGLFQHPHRNVITGILLAAVTEETNCELVVTGTFHQDKINYPTEAKFPGFPRNWEDYVTILDPENGDKTPYITIGREGRPPNTKKWEPEPAAR